MWSVVALLGVLLLLNAGVYGADSKRVVVYQNGASTGGVELTLTRSQFEDDSWKKKLNDVQPVVKNHHTPGAAPVAQVFTGRGVEVKKFDDFEIGERLYVVAEGLLFVWPFVSLGFNVTVQGDILQLPNPEEYVILESISDRPRILRIHHFFSPDEADALVDNVQKITDARFKLKRSTTGVETDPDKVVYAKTRTSENAFDTNTPTAMALKRRMFKLLRIGEYQEDMADGLQLLRYKQKQAYIPHHDWFDSNADREFNFDPALGGSNRFATVFLYLSDVEEGGQTVFPLVDTPEGVHGVERRELPETTKELFQSRDWEADMLEKCYSKLAFQPAKASALLFYSQTGSGVLDDLSLHGACPVLKGTKWGANLWVWNKARHGLYPNQNTKGEVPKHLRPVTAAFVNRADVAVDILWSGSVMQTVPPGERTSFNTFNDHSWEAAINGDVFWKHTIDVDDGNAQTLYMDFSEDEDVVEKDEL